MLSPRLAGLQSRPVRQQPASLWHAKTPVSPQNSCQRRSSDFQFELWLVSDASSRRKAGRCGVCSPTATCATVSSRRKTLEQGFPQPVPRHSLPRFVSPAISHSLGESEPNSHARGSALSGWQLRLGRRRAKTAPLTSAHHPAALPTPAAFRDVSALLPNLRPPKTPT